MHFLRIPLRFLHVACADVRAVDAIPHPVNVARLTSLNPWHGYHRYSDAIVIPNFKHLQA